jgi:DNA polymerase (family 10)/histidinol-phosphatase (PHP family)
MRRTNLHNHTRFSDGRFTAADIIAAAQDAGLHGVGISDHFFTRKVFRHQDLGEYLAGPWQGYLRERMRWQATPPARLRVWWGIELDSCLDRVGCGLEDLPWRELNALDFLLIEYVGENLGGLTLEDLAALREVCTIPVILAHPDLDRLTESLPFSEVSAILQRSEIALELPGGSRNPWFWHRYDPQLLRDLRLAIGCDVHDRLEEVGATGKTERFLEQNGLLAQVVDPDTWTIKGGNP